jgi:hypothetical protein
MEETKPLKALHRDTCDRQHRLNQGYFFCILAAALALGGCIPPEERITPIQQQRAINIGVKLDTHGDGRAEVSSLYLRDLKTVLANLRYVMEKRGGTPDKTLEGTVHNKYVGWWDFDIYSAPGLAEGHCYEVPFLVQVQAVQTKKGQGTLVTFSRYVWPMSFWECNLILSLTEDLEEKLQKKSILLEELASDIKSSR